MCAQFVIKSRIDDLANKFGIKMNQEFAKDFVDLRVHGYMKTESAPVIFMNDHNELEIRMMNFSLCPSWSKEYPCAFSTYNARMERPKKGSKSETERIYQVPTWRESFVGGNTCLVPMNGAIESSYFGHSAGKMIQFSQKDNSVYFALGLWSQWLNKTTGEVYDTFTLITDDPYKFFFEQGHDRSILVVDERVHEKWLTEKNLNPEARFNFIRDHRTDLNWIVKTDREMKMGWQKRAPSKKEIDEIRVWDSGDYKHER